MFGKLLGLLKALPKALFSSLKDQLRDEALKEIDSMDALEPQLAELIAKYGPDASKKAVDLVQERMKKIVYKVFGGSAKEENAGPSTEA